MVLTGSPVSPLARRMMLGATVLATLMWPGLLRGQDLPHDFWSFQPIRRPPVPTLSDRFDSESVHNAIDHFVLQKLAQRDVLPNAPARRRTLIRRAYYDLTGLPPSPDEVEAFHENRAPDAYAKLVDRLLASPRYGEKWGRHWLDLVRYAETNSYERDGTKENAWRYRDYVIESFNSDKPYDQFIREQLAGDEMRPRTNEHLIATGYYRLGIWDDEPADEVQALYDDLDDILTTTSQVFLGLTMNCARCHDHKLDPIPQADYYRMLSFFAGVHRYGGPGRNGRDVTYSQAPLVPHEQFVQYQETRNTHQKRLHTIKRKINSAEESLKKMLPPGDADDFEFAQNRLAVLERHVPERVSQTEFEKYLRLLSRKKELEDQAPARMDTALVVKEIGSTPREMHVLVRGNPHVPGDPVQPGYPEVLGFPDPEIDTLGDSPSCGRRSVLADWIASAENPLTARVMANRVWQYHFGQGLVASPNDFGLTGDRPTHPELLDWLASELIDSGWKLKHLHRLIMNSATYQRASSDNPQAVAIDPKNRWLWRYSMRRLTAEEIRDSILAINGSLYLKMHGPSFFPDIPAEVLAGQSRPGEGWGKSPEDERNRRSIYIFLKRSLITPMIAGWDGPDTDFTCPVRFATTQPTQALSMMNGEYVRQQAGILATRAQAQAEFLRHQVIWVLKQVTQRPPTEDEVTRGVRLVEELANKNQMRRQEALEHFCVVALNLNEFVYLD